jgi:uncharacterized protein (TIGR03085 family)
MTSWAAHERAALVEALGEVGPDAPTLCEGWTAADLAAHVYVRERRPDAALGVLPLGPLSAYTNRVMRSVLRIYSYDELLRKVAEVSPILRVTHLDEAINVIEFFIHTEDVRRPNKLALREMPEEFERKVWSRLARQGRMSFRRVPARVRLVPSVGEPVEFGTGELVEVHGKPTELLMLAFNRKADAKVQYDGSQTAIDALQGARIGL